MKALVLGRGVLGTALAPALAAEGWEVEVYSGRDGIDIADYWKLYDLRVRAARQPDVVINAAGVIDREAPPPALLRANATGPALVDSVWPIVVHVSTDCVFRPSPHTRFDFDAPDPEPGDLYGLSKAAGEMASVLNVRTSFVGPGSRMWLDVERAARGGLPYGGWRNTLWSGGWVEDVADVLARVAVPDAVNGRVGVVHASLVSPITKLALARLIADRIGRPAMTIIPVDGPMGRVLTPTYGYELPLLT